MRGSWRIARIMGIDITIDISWLIIFFLMIYTLGFIEFPHELHPRAFTPRPDVISVGLGIAASLLLFGSVLAHELSHSWMAIERGIPVKRIVLFIFGGVAQITDEPDRPSSEFLIAIMGPLMSVALAAVFGAAWIWLRLLDSFQLLGIPLTPLILLCNILFQANGSLALFNLAPGFPLDGGRVLRAILWGISRDIRRATRWATRAGQGIALILVGAGSLLFLGSWFPFIQSNGNGVWFALIGLFLWNAAGEGYRQTLILQVLRGVSVDQLMTRDVATVSPDISIAEFVDQYLLHRRDQTFAVSDGIALQGLIALDQVKRTPRAEWNVRRVRDAMTPITRIASLAPNETAGTALTRLLSADASELPVIDAGQLVGFLGHGELARYLRLKSEIGRK